MKRTKQILAAWLTTAALVAPAAAETELVFWSMWNEQEPQAQALREVMDAYSAKNPDISFATVWNGRQNQVKIRAALQAGTEIDFMDQDGDQLAGGLAAAGLGLPLNELAASLSGQMLPAVLDLYQSGDDIVQMPYIYNPVSFWYNVALFGEMGVEPPASVSDLIAACGVAQENDINLLVTEGNVGNYQLFHFSYLMQRIAGPGALREVIADKSGESWRSDAVRQALDAEAAMWAAGCFSDDVKGFQYPTGQQTLALDEAAAELVGAWLPAELSKAVEEDFQWGSFAFPTVDGGKGGTGDLQASLLTMMVFKDSPKADKAVDFIEYLMSAEGQQVIATTGKVGVTRNDVPWSDAIKDGYALAGAATNIMAINDATNVFFPEFHATVLAPTHTSFFLGDITADDFVEQMVEKSAAFWVNQN